MNKGMYAQLTKTIGFQQNLKMEIRRKEMFGVENLGLYFWIFIFGYGVGRLQAYLNKYGK